MKRQIMMAAICMAVLATCRTGFAWHGMGHHLATRLAVAALGDELPDFFRQGAAAVAHASLDPDAFTRPIAEDNLHDQERPQQYIDLELLSGRPLPPKRSEFFALCARLRLNPSKVGMAPYSVTEWTQRLTVAFAEHRRWPDNPYIRQKALVYAGLLAHYAQDICQPLHTTVHYDGRAGAGGASPRTGIHQKVDALIGKLDLGAAGPPSTAPAKSPGERAAASRLKPVAFEDLFAAVCDRLHRSHALVEEVYKLEAELPDPRAALDPKSAAAAFARERLQACAEFTACLYLTAWRNSARTRLPDWHIRERALDGFPESQPAAGPGGRGQDVE